MNDNGDWIEKDLPTPVGDYGQVYDAMYAAIIEKESKLVTDQELLIDMRILEAGVSEQGPHVKEF